MEEEKQTNKQIETLMATWTAAVTDTWGSMFKTWSRMLNPDSPASSIAATSMGNALDAWTTALKTWEMFSGTSPKSDTMDSLFKGMGILPDILLKMSQTMVSNLTQFQLKGIEKAKGLGKTVATIDFGDIDENMFQAWKELYQKDLRQYLNVPQLGLARFHQERILQTIDKYNIFQTTFFFWDHKVRNQRNETKGNGFLDQLMDCHIVR